MRLSRLEDGQVVRLYYDLVRVLHVYKEELLPPTTRKEAYRLCKGIDETDAPHVAITLALDGLLWTGDEKLKAGLRSQGFDQFLEPGTNTLGVQEGSGE